MNTVWELTWGLYKPLHGYHYTYYIHTLLLHMSQTVGSYETCGMQYCPQEWDSTVWVVTSVPSSDNGTDAYQTYAVTVSLQQLATTICTLYSVAISQCHYHTRQPAAAAPDDLRTTATLELSVYIRTYIIVHGLDMIIMYIKRKVGNTQLSKRHVVNYHLMNESVCVCVCVCSQISSTSL